MSRVTASRRSSSCRRSQRSYLTHPVPTRMLPGKTREGGSCDPQEGVLGSKQRSGRWGSRGARGWGSARGGWGGGGGGTLKSSPMATVTGQGPASSGDRRRRRPSSPSMGPRRGGAPGSPERPRPPSRLCPLRASVPLAPLTERAGRTASVTCERGRGARSAERWGLGGWPREKKKTAAGGQGPGGTPPRRGRLPLPGAAVVGRMHYYFYR